MSDLASESGANVPGERADDESAGRLRVVKLSELLKKCGEAMGLADGQEAEELRPEALGLLEWGQRFLPQHFFLPPSSMHRWLAERLAPLANERGAKLNALGPRLGAKSTVVTLAYALRMALEHREAYLWLVSDTKHQAQGHLENLKAELVDNPRLAKAYPDGVGRGPVWRAGRIVLRNGVAVDAFGSGQRIRGHRHREHRPSLIVCDDLQNDSHIESSTQRARSRTWFHGTLLKAGTPETNVINLATALHREALALQLHATPGWTSRVFHAIEQWPQNMLLWETWESLYADPENPQAIHDARQFYDAHRAAMEAGAELLWPEREDLYTLMCMRVESGRTAFEREKQNSPVDPERCEFPEAYFDERIWFDEWPTTLRLKILALDPSKGTDARRSDYSALVRVGLDGQGIFFVEADLARRPLAQIIADAAEHCRQFCPDAFGVESNQFQELLGPALIAEFRRQGLLALDPWLIDNRLNKLVRIRRLGPFLAARRLRLKTKSPSTKLLLDQLREFPVADHDDGPDALEMAIRLASELLGRPDDGLGHRLPVG